MAVECHGAASHTGAGVVLLGLWGAEGGGVRWWDGGGEVVGQVVAASSLHDDPTKCTFKATPLCFAA